MAIFTTDDFDMPQSSALSPMLSWLMPDIAADKKNLIPKQGTNNLTFDKIAIFLYSKSSQPCRLKAQTAAQRFR